MTDLFELELTELLFEEIVASVRRNGDLARELQKRLKPEDLRRKADGSVVTTGDWLVQDNLIGDLQRLLPGAAIVAEESERESPARAPLTIVIDPIDGTDVYSLGLPGWCVSVGIMDDGYVPRAGIIYAPALDLMLTAHRGPALRNGERFSPPSAVSCGSPRANIMVHSRIHNRVRLERFPGKIRSLGSAALHLCSTLAYPGISAALEGGGAHVWDIAGAHAILMSHGYDIEYLRGGTLSYAALMDGRGVGGPLVGGAAEQRAELRELVALRDE